MHTLRATVTFKKKYQKVVGVNTIMAKRVQKTLQQLEKDPYYSGLKTHKVGEYRSSWVSGDIRIIWQYDNLVTSIINLYDIGGHDGSGGVYT